MYLQYFYDTLFFNNKLWSKLQYIVMVLVVMMNLFQSIEINDIKIKKYTKARRELEWSMYIYL